MCVFTKRLYFVGLRLTTQPLEVVSLCSGMFLTDICAIGTDVSGDAMVESSLVSEPDTMDPAFSCRCHWTHCFLVQCLIVIPGD